MYYLKTHLNIVYAVVFLVLAVIFFIVFYGFQFNKKASVDSLKIIKTEIEHNKLPELFPKDIPIEKDAKIIQNYNAISPDGRFQATRKFETRKSLNENFEIYQNYFKLGGWNITSSVNEENFKTISGTKDAYKIQVSIGVNSVSNTKTVDISLTKTSK